MAMIANPTWAEVQVMTELELDAFNIVKGEANGDEFLWDRVWVDPKTGIQVKGVWKSLTEKKK